MAASGSPSNLHLGGDHRFAKRNSGMFNISALAAGPVEESAEDGPLFQATVLELERGALQLKSRIKQVIKLTQAFVERDRAADAAFGELLDCLKGMESLAPATDLISSVFTRVKDAKDAYHHQLENLLVDPLQKMYENDLKIMDAQKKAFDQESQEYNQYLAKYLATDRDKNAAKLEQRDKQFLSRRVTYNLIRFDYLNFMEELHTRKEQEVMYHVSSLADKMVAFYARCAKAAEASRGDLERLNSRVSASWTDISAWRKERMELRKLIEESGHAAAEKIMERAAQQTSAGAKVNLFHGIRDLNPTANDGAGHRSSGDKKEGSLYTRHSKRSEWRRVWCVLDNGVFQEYTQLKPDSKPKHQIDLRTCTVKPSLKAERRFCFEIISPQMRYVYQATSHEEMMIWMQVIQSAIESALERRVSFHSMPAPASQDAAAAVSDKDRVRRELLKDPSNAVCADCGMRDPDWAVINLGVVVCIQCSGVHRSLGTHISKVRSITLDTTSWTPELLAVQSALGNAAVNGVLEARPPADGSEKPLPTASREEHVRYITAKYVQHAFCQPRDAAADPLKALLQAAVQDDVVGALRALAWGAGVNALPTDDGDSEDDLQFHDAADGNESFGDADGAAVSPALLLAPPAAATAGGHSSGSDSVSSSRGSGPSPQGASPLSPVPPGAGGGVGSGAGAGASASGGHLPSLTLGDDHEPVRVAIHSASGTLHQDQARRFGLGPLHQAVRAGNVTVAEFLIQNGADVTLPDRSGWTALHYAAEREDEAMIAYLIGRGAKLDAVNSAGQRPCDLVSAGRKDSKLVSLLSPSPPGTVSSGHSTETAATTTATASTAASASAAPPPGSLLAALSSLPIAAEKVTQLPSRLIATVASGHVPPSSAAAGATAATPTTPTAPDPPDGSSGTWV